MAVDNRLTATREQKLDAIGRLWFLPAQERRRLIAEVWGIDLSEVRRDA